MHLSSNGHEVAVVDNYLRRNICREEDVEPLFDVPSLNERVRFWEEMTGYSIPVFIGDLMDWTLVEKAFKEFIVSFFAYV